jgi:mRNA interferase RelE/StbE
MTSMYQVKLLKPAVHELESLDKSTGARIIQRLHWLAENIGSITPKKLTGQLSGLCKLREGDYRIIYQAIHKEKSIVVYCIGHRRDIYKNR